MVLGRAKPALKRHFRRPAGCVSPALGTWAEPVLFDGRFLSYSPGHWSPEHLLLQPGPRCALWARAGHLLSMPLLEASGQLMNFVKAQSACEVKQKTSQGRSSNLTYSSREDLPCASHLHLQTEPLDIDSGTEAACFMESPNSQKLEFL